MALPQPDAVVPSTHAGLVKISRLADSRRSRMLDRLGSYYSCTQHDFKSYTWDGSRAGSDTNPGADWDIMPGYYVPYKSRRPSAPYRLAKVIVDRFTALLFGVDHWPKLKVEGDAVAEDFIEALIEAAQMRTAMVQARTYGGAMGSVGLSYKWLEGRPRVEVHNPKHIHVLEWEDREALVPAAVAKTYKYVVDEFDHKDNKLKPVVYQYYREWTITQDVRYYPARIGDGNREPEWKVQEAIEHKLGFCPFVWVQNQPSEDIDGDPDYVGLTPVFDQLDILASAISAGAAANVDPTLVLRMDRDLIMAAGGQIRKGSDNAIYAGEGGDAHYLELQGTSVQIGISLIETLRKYALEVAQCVLADPDKISGAAQSAKAIEYLYAPMLARADILREQYGQALRRVVDGLRAAARAVVSQGMSLVLPARHVEEKNADTGEITSKMEPRLDPGTEAEARVEWGAYFDLTPQDVQQAVSTAQAATGGKPVISQETAVRKVAALFDVRDIDAELDRVAQDEEAAQQAAQQRDASLFGPGATPKPPMDDEEPEEETGGPKGPGGHPIISAFGKPRDPAKPGIHIDADPNWLRRK